MLILNKAFVRLHLQNFYRCSIHTVTQSVPINKQNSDTVTTKRKKNLIVNFKYGPAPSDPLYENLIYSTEAEVYLTAKKGKAWLEMQVRVFSLPKQPIGELDCFQLTNNRPEHLARPSLL